MPSGGSAPRGAHSRSSKRNGAEIVRTCSRRAKEYSSFIIYLFIKNGSSTKSNLRFEESKEGGSVLFEVDHGPKLMKLSNGATHTRSQLLVVFLVTILGQVTFLARAPP